jgi:thioredoxin-related protein
MKKPGWIGVLLIVACACIFLQSSGAFCAEPAEKLSTVTFTLPAPDSVQTQTYLGLEAMKPFKVSDIKAKMAIIELMSARCPHCQANAPTMNKIYRTIQADSGLADIKVVAVAIADDKANVEAFKEQFKTPFPILLDESHEIKSSMPGLGTPTTLVVSTEDGKVLYRHPGEIPDADEFVKQVKFVKQLEAFDKKQ